MNFQKFCAEILPHITFEGKPINDFEDAPDNLEFLDDETKVWTETQYAISELNIDGHEYRIRPRPEYRPFTKEYEEMFFGKKIYTNTSKQPSLIIDCCDNGVWIAEGADNKFLSYKTLVELFVFPNNEPCGVML